MDEVKFGGKSIIVIAVLEVVLLLSGIGIMFWLSSRIDGLENQVSLLSERITQIDRKGSIDSISSQWFSLDEAYKEKAGAKAKELIPELIRTKSVLGGKWMVTETKFVSPNLISYTAEDGHIVASGVALVMQDDDEIRLSILWEKE